MCVGFGALKIQDRIQTIPLPWYRGRLIEDVRTSNSYLSGAPLLEGGRGAGDGGGGGGGGGGARLERLQHYHIP